MHKPKSESGPGRLCHLGGRLRAERMDGGPRAARQLPQGQFPGDDRSRGPAADRRRPRREQRGAHREEDRDARHVRTGGQRGYAYFQGFFFGRPLILQGRDVPGHQLAHLRLLRALNDPDLSVHQLENLIKHDGSLCYRVLRTVNSAGFAQRREIESIRQALVLLGVGTVRRWAALWLLAGLSEGAHPELVVMSTVRARCCELLAGSLAGDKGAALGFLLGMCSMLDVILERPMETLLSELPLPDSTLAALRGDNNDSRKVLDCAIAYERGEWDRCLYLAGSAGIDPKILPIAHRDALKWSEEFQKLG